jgi:hypothetical protein
LNQSAEKSVGHYVDLYVELYVDVCFDLVFNLGVDICPSIYTSKGLYLKRLIYQKAYISKGIQTYPNHRRVLTLFGLLINPAFNYPHPFYQPHKASASAFLKFSILEPLAVGWTRLHKKTNP